MIRPLSIALVVACASLAAALTLVASTARSAGQRVTEQLGDRSLVVSTNVTGRVSSDPAATTLLAALGPDQPIGPPDLVASVELAGERERFDRTGIVLVEVPPSTRFRIVSGRRPEKAGEVALTTALAKLIGGRRTVDLFVPGASLDVVGTYVDRSSTRSQGLLAAPGTWDGLDWPLIERSGAGAGAQASFPLDPHLDTRRVSSRLVAAGLDVAPTQAGDTLAMAPVAVTSAAAVASLWPDDPLTRYRFQLTAVALTVPALLSLAVVVVETARIRRLRSLLVALGLDDADVARAVAMGLARRAVPAIVGTLVGVGTGLVAAAIAADRIAGRWTGGGRVPLTQCVAVGVTPMIVLAVGGVLVTRRDAERLAVVRRPRERLRPATWVGLGIGSAIVAAATGADYAPSSDLTVPLVAALGLGVAASALSLRPAADLLRRRSVLARYAAAQVDAYQRRTLALVAILVFSLGYAGSRLTLDSSLALTDSTTFVGGLPRGVVAVVDPTGGSDVPLRLVDDVAHELGQEPVGWDSVTGDPMVGHRYSIERNGDRFDNLVAIEHSDDFATVFGRAPSSDERRVLAGGGAVLFTRALGVPPDARPSGSRFIATSMDPNATGTISSRGPIDSIVSLVDRSWANRAGGVVLTGTARRLQAEVRPEGAAFVAGDTGVERARRIAQRRGLTERAIDAYVPFRARGMRPLTALTFVVAAISLFGAATSAFAAVTASMRSGLSALTAVGVGATAPRSVLLAYAGGVAALAMVGTLVSTIVVIVIVRANAHGLLVSIPYAQLGVLTAVTAAAFGAVIAAQLRRAASLSSSTWARSRRAG